MSGWSENAKIDGIEAQTHAIEALTRALADLALSRESEANLLGINAAQGNQLDEDADIIMRLTAELTALRSRVEGAQAIVDAADIACREHPSYEEFDPIRKALGLPLYFDHPSDLDAWTLAHDARNALIPPPSEPT